ncbi:ATP-binding cassette domain-containing protein [Gordonia amarae]|uniref:ATP-binding cassette domain-containing protein n=2 Tax=Gordonia amarae TaxID=36821 RepID=A0A857KGR2_9ACTN|nr:branched-chain amino acid ABC transporter permease/ATP-binding protein [Gordonia amarae]MCS3877641.1 ABC-type branched-subunit amino acid transport system ATPase component/ABC-type branched-subunit amino acid transport system permease subunit [Gordonia amarae]QHN16353.1 ATP-binding cassette domain-containing protein [Gordonia amarae]QHN20922.1 ATP-binding cassette domain-containing protein [Gordonia amarae]QHN29773.1 ATP-binding cassette domain-containing protein [Gordonia amarae]QHN38548.1
MADHLVFLALGLGNGAVFAALGLALVMTYKSSGVVNFATGAIALYAAYTYAFLRKGELLNPIPGLPARIDLGQELGVAAATVIAVSISAVLGVLLYLLVFRWMRSAQVLAKAVVSIGLMLVVQALIALRVGADTPAVAAIFPKDTVGVGDGAVPVDRLWLAGVVVLMALASGLVLRYTRFGLATRAAAESEKGALLSGLSPEKIAISNWALSSATAAVGGIVIAPIVALSPVGYTMFIVPALAAALVGNFSSIGVTVGAGIAIGMLQSEATNLQTSISWFPDVGVAEAIPLVLIIGFLLLRGQPLPGRGAVTRGDLGRCPRPRNVWRPVAIGVPVVALALAVTSGQLGNAVVTSIILAIVALSQVVISGYAGQASLAQLTLAGVGAFSLSRITTDLGVPFPFAPVLAALAALAVGVVVGLPALRVRGLPLMAVTLALAVFLEAFWFRNPSFNGGLNGSPVAEPSIFGIDLGIGAGEHYPRFGFGIVSLVFLTIVLLGVAWLPNSRLGTSMLAVRANERSAAASGINVGVVKLTAFGISAFIAGLGGSLIGYQQHMASESSYGVFAGVGLFAICYIAGVTSISSGLLAGLMASGGLLFYLMDRYLHFGEWYLLVSGVLLVVTVMANPDGLARYIHERHSAPRSPADISGDEPVQAFAPVRGGRAIGEVILEVDRVGVRYGAVTAVDDAGFDVREGEIVGLIGPNGAGKTTLMDAISGFTPATGDIRLDGIGIGGLPPHRRARAGLGRTFQDIELYDELTVAENVMVGGSDTGVLARLGIADLAQVPASDLSQGQRQLVSVARILAGAPRLALLDEPAAGLDSSESRWLGERLRAARDSGVTMLLVDHDMDLVLSICDRIIVLDLGKVIATGTPDDIRNNPAVVGAYLGTPVPA